MPHGVEDWPQFSSYTHLDRDKKEIRLLRVHPKHEKGELSFSVVHHALDGPDGRADDKPYYALSYVWGSPGEPQRIYVEGEPVDIRATLWRALDSLRNRLQRTSDDGLAFASPSGVLMSHFYIWVDFLCINQDDILERNFQVSLMDRVFGAAEGVFGWLGDSDPVSAEAFDLLLNARTADDFALERYEGERLKAVNGAMSILMNFEYWKRVWIIQEFILSRRFWICSGDRLISWEDYSTLFAKREHKGTVLPEDVDTQERRVAMTKARMFRIVKNTGIHKAPMSDLMSMAFGYKCSDPRDHVYGLLGIVQPSDREKLVVDYRKPFFQVFIEACSLPQLPTGSHYFFCSLLELCDGPGVGDVQRQILENRLSVPDVQLEGDFVGIITDLRLRAVVCGAGESLRLHLPTTKCDYGGNEHSYLYESQADACMHRYNKAAAIESRVSVSFSSTELQIGDALIEIMSPLRGELVHRAALGQDMHIVGVTARSYLPELGTFDSAKEWLQTKQVLDPRQWHSKRLKGEQYPFVDAELAKACVSKACAACDPQIWQDTKVVFSFNCVALVNFLQEELWPHYDLKKKGWLNTIDGWLQEL